MFRTPQSQRYIDIALVMLQFMGLMFIVILTMSNLFHWHAFDLSVYASAANRVMQGRVPYRDFLIEYPPLALLPFTLPRLLIWGRNPAGYVWLFLVQNALFSTLIALILGQICTYWCPQRAHGPTLLVYALAVVVSAPLLPWRYDIFPALLTIAALLALLRERPGWAGWWLGLGVAAKLYPIVLLPIFGLYYFASQKWRALFHLSTGSLIAVSVTFAPFVLLAPDSLLAFVRYHELRGLQLESLPSGVIVLAHLFGKVALHMVFNYGALHLVAPLAVLVVNWLLFAFIGLFALLLICALLRFRQEYLEDVAISPATLVAYSMTALLVFIVTNKVFSPQYIIWLLPFAALLRLRHASLMLLICALTIALFPYDYNDLLKMQLDSVLLLNLRNLLVLGLLLWLLVEYAPAWVRIRRLSHMRPDPNDRSLR